MSVETTDICASGSVGGARPCQGRGRGFESRLALLKSPVLTGLFLFLLHLIRIRECKTNGGSYCEKMLDSIFLHARFVSVRTWHKLGMRKKGVRRNED